MLTVSKSPPKARLNHWDDLIVVKICDRHGLYAPLIEDDSCNDNCSTVALFVSFLEFYVAIKPANVIVL